MNNLWATSKIEDAVYQLILKRASVEFHEYIDDFIAQPLLRSIYKFNIDDEEE